MTTDSTIVLSPGSPSAEAHSASLRRNSEPAYVGCYKQVGTLAKKEFNDRFRSGWVTACAIVWLGAIALTSFLGLLQIGRIGVQGYERTVMSLLNLVQYLVPLLGLLLGHDVIVSEKEEGTLRLILASGISRSRVLLGKFLGGSVTLAVPLLLGFAIAGAAIGLTARDNAIGPFLRLAASGFGLGILFLGIGITVSSFSRTRVQSLVLSLLVWCCAVFVFDLVALGVLVSTHAPAAAHDIEIVCDATHVNVAADLHSDFDVVSNTQPRSRAESESTSLGWLGLNPVDLFRAINLSEQMAVRMPVLITLFSVTLWLALPLGASWSKLLRSDF